MCMLCVHMYVQVPVHVCSSKVDIRCLLLLFPLAFETGSPAEPRAETGLPVDPGVLCLCLPDTEAPDFFFFCDVNAGNELAGRSLWSEPAP